MLQAGITGGIGAGKSIVCRLFTLLGVPVFNADLSARLLMESDAQLKEALKELLGSDSYFQDGSLNRAFIASLAFRDPGLLHKMNALIHPFVIDAYQNWVKQQGNTDYTLLESAIMIETGIHTLLDKVILVDAPEDIRIKRVSERDHRSEDDIKAIITRQWSTDRKKKHASFVILNDDKHLVIPQVIQIDCILRLKSE